MEVKDIVFQDYQGIRRYGVVREKFSKGAWAHFMVDWVDDDEYNQAMGWLAQLRGQDFYRQVYRLDELRNIDADRELQTLFRCLELSNT